MNPLAKRIKDLRARRGMTQASLAKRAGLTLAYIGRLEIGRYDPQVEHASTTREAAKSVGGGVGGVRIKAI